MRTQPSQPGADDLSRMYAARRQSRSDGAKVGPQPQQHEVGLARPVADCARDAEAVEELLRRVRLRNVRVEMRAIAKRRLQCAHGADVQADGGNRRSGASVWMRDQRAHAQRRRAMRFANVRPTMTFRHAPAADQSWFDR